MAKQNAKSFSFGLRMKDSEVFAVGQSSEYEHRKNLNKVRDNINKKVKDIRDQFSKLEKVKVEALKKTEEMRRSIASDLARIEESMSRGTDLTPDSKKAIASEIAILKDEVEKKSSELRSQISQIAIP